MLRDTANESRYDGVDSNSSSRYVLAGSLVSAAAVWRFVAAWR